MEGVDYLADERRRAEFDVDAMKIVWAGSKHAFHLVDRMSKLVANDPVPILLSLPLFAYFLIYAVLVNVVILMRLLNLCVCVYCSDCLGGLRYFLVRNCNLTGMFF